LRLVRSSPFLLETLMSEFSSGVTAKSVFSSGKQSLGMKFTASLLCAAAMVFTAGECRANGASVEKSAPNQIMGEMFAANYASQDDSSVVDLLAVLEETTAIATRSKLNQDHVPGIVTILRGSDMEARGARTVWEALAWVPGLDPLISNYGDRKVVSRGISEANDFGLVRQINVLLNDVQMTDATTGNANPILNMPMEQVDRIEVIRGPGSTIYGEFSYTAVINIITKKNDKKITASVASFNTYTGTAVYSYENSASELTASLNLAGLKSGGAHEQAGEDFASRLYHLNSYSPGPVSDSMVFRSGVFKLGKGDFDFSAQLIDAGYGEHFGARSSLPAESERIAISKNSYTTEAAYRPQISKNLSAAFKLGAEEHSELVDRIQYYPPGGSPYFPDGIFESDYFKEHKFSAAAELIWKGWERHEWLFVASASHTRIADAWIDYNMDAATFEPLSYMKRYKGDNNWVDEDSTRFIKNITLQDSWHYSDNLDLTGGARYDDYDDVGNNVSPRFSAVWHLDRDNILKAQYAKAYRPPTFYEIAATGPKSLKLTPETIETYELGYVYAAQVVIARMTLFYSDMNGTILNYGLREPDAWGYRNYPGATSRGAEGEIEWRVSESLKAITIISYAKTVDKRTDADSNESVNLMSNTALVWQPHKQAVFVASWRHVGERNRDPADIRSGKLAGYDTFDFIANFMNIGGNGFSARLGVKNIFDTAVTFPSQVYHLEDGSVAPIYNDDLPMPKRQLWLQFAYEL